MQNWRKEKKNEKAEKTVEEEEDIVLCLLTSKSEKGKNQESKICRECLCCVQLMGKIPFIHKEHVDWRFGCLMSYYQWCHQPLWCHWYQGVGTREFRQYTPTTKMVKLWLKVYQVDDSERLHVLCPMKYFAKAGTNLHSLTC